MRSLYTPREPTQRPLSSPSFDELDLAVRGWTANAKASDAVDAEAQPITEGDAC